jgi:hypothetical protein
MRIRQVKPGFWIDSTIADLSIPTRLTYIGMWLLADDAGWFRWDIPTIAAELYSFESRTKRERDVATQLDVLQAAGRIVREPDCRHASIPTLTSHQRFSAPDKRVFTFLNEHKATCHQPTPAGTRGEQAVPRNGKERSVEETERGREGGGAGEGTTDWAARVEETQRRNAG